MSYVRVLSTSIFRKGTTAVLNEKIIRKEELGNFVSIHEITEEADKMEVDT